MTRTITTFMLTYLSAGLKTTIASTKVHFTDFLWHNLPVFNNWLQNGWLNVDIIIVILPATYVCLAVTLVGVFWCRHNDTGTCRGCICHIGLTDVGGCWIFSAVGLPINVMSGNVSLLSSSLLCTWSSLTLNSFVAKYSLSIFIFFFHIPLLLFHHCVIHFCQSSEGPLQTVQYVLLETDRLGRTVSQL